MKKVLTVFSTAVILAFFAGCSQNANPLDPSLSGQAVSTATSPFNNGNNSPLSGLILWNKMNNANSIVGCDATAPDGSALAGSVFAQGSAFCTGSGEYVWFRQQDFTGLENRGTVELTFKSDLDSATIPICALFNIEGTPRNGNGGGGILNVLFLGGQLWIDAETYPAGTVFTADVPLTANDTHVLRVYWNVAGLDASGNDLVAIFDGQEVIRGNIVFQPGSEFLSCQDSMGPNRPDLTVGNGTIDLFGSGYDLSSSGRFFSGSVSEIKVWNRVETGF